MKRATLDRNMVKLGMQKKEQWMENSAYFSEGLRNVRIQGIYAALLSKLRQRYCCLKFILKAKKYCPKNTVKQQTKFTKDEASANLLSDIITSRTKKLHKHRNSTMVNDNSRMLWCSRSNISQSPRSLKLHMKTKSILARLVIFKQVIFLEEKRGLVQTILLVVEADHAFQGIPQTAGPHLLWLHHL